MNNSLTSLIILTMNNLDRTVKCLESIRKYTSQPYELIFVDNGSTDGTPDYLKQFPDVRLILNQHNKGFAGGTNQGMKLAQGQQLLLLNNDTIVSHRWLDNLLKALQLKPRVGMVGPLSNQTIPPQQYSPPYTNDSQYHRFAANFNRHNPAKWKTVQALSGFCLLFKREVLEKIGYMDERFIIGNYEDIDYCYRASLAGYTLLAAGDTFVHHEGNSSFKNNNLDYSTIFLQNRNKFIEKWNIYPERLVR